MRRQLARLRYAIDTVIARWNNLMYIETVFSIVISFVVLWFLWKTTATALLANLLTSVFVLLARVLASVLVIVLKLGLTLLCGAIGAFTFSRLLVLVCHFCVQTGRDYSESRKLLAQKRKKESIQRQRVGDDGFRNDEPDVFTTKESESYT